MVLVVREMSGCDMQVGSSKDLGEKNIWRGCGGSSTFGKTEIGQFCYGDYNPSLREALRSSQPILHSAYSCSA